MKKIVTKETLKIYDEYHGDFGLLEERWASEKDRQRVSDEQAFILSQYVDDLHFANVKNLSKELKEKTLARIIELESKIEQDVMDTIKRRMPSSPL